MRAAIQVRDLWKRYGEKEVLRGLDLQVCQGEIFALLGVNGAGKTTALECMEGLRRCDGGQIRIWGKIGIQLQSASLPGAIQVREAVEWMARWKKTEPDPAVLEALDLKPLAKRQYGRLSTGQKRRLHLALALLGDPEVLFLDEPSAGLDVEGRAALHEQIRRLREQGKTIVLASHDMAEVETLCDRLGILRDGRLAFQGTAGELAEQVGGRCTVRIRTEQGEETWETEDVGHTLLQVLTAYQREGRTVLDLKVDRGTLEQQFLAMAGREVS